MVWGILRNRKEELEELIDTGREIEFEYNGKEYSITYCQNNSEMNYLFVNFTKNQQIVRQ